MKNFNSYVLADLETRLDRVLTVMDKVNDRRGDLLTVMHLTLEGSKLDRWYVWYSDLIDSLTSEIKATEVQIDEILYEDEQAHVKDHMHWGRI